VKVVAQSLTRPKPGEALNGDVAVIRAEGDRLLLAVIDALGHGEMANQVAERAREFLSRADLKAGVRSLLSGLHEVLARGRGAAGTVCVADGSHVEYGGVGNVELRATSIALGMHQTDGVLGHLAPRIRIASSELKVGQRLLLFTDGISEHFSLADFSSVPVPEVCQTLLDRFARPTDDATVLVAEVTP
jgi:negative regulator of sigma-B (phosphoserine phosphatase)